MPPKPSVPSPETPIELDRLHTGQPKDVAAGLPAVAKALEHVFGEAGLIRGPQALLGLNQFDGFDCPGCAWPDPDGHRSFAEYCENGAKAIAEEATTKRVTREFFAQYAVEALSRKSDYWLGKSGRLTEPMVLRTGASHYEPIRWEDAFEIIGSTLNGLASPDLAAFYTSGRTSNEAAFLYQLFVRQFGTNNLPDCSNMCHESSGAGLGEAIGVGKGTVTLDDFELADAIFVIGQNPGTNHPRMLTALEAAAKRGCKIVSINPLAETGLKRFRHPQHPLEVLGPGTPIACLHLPVRINGDVALLKGIVKEILAEEERRPGQVLDHRFIAEYTTGFEDFRAAVEQVDWADIVEQTGLDREQVRAAARVAIEAKSLICCWAMGLTQHQNAVANIQEIVNLLLLGGHLGRPGAGACPVRGHSNVQGDRTMGIFERMPDQFLDRLGSEFEFNPPRRHGHDTVDCIRAMHAGQVKVFIAMGGNFLSAAPDTLYTADALRQCDLTVQVSTKLNRSHLITGRQALILPCLGRTERDIQTTGAQFVTVEDSMSVVHSSKGSLAPASRQLRSEPAIVAGMAKATLRERSKVDWDYLISDYDRIRDRVERVIPGFEDYNARVRKPGGFYLPNNVKQRRFATRAGKARFMVHDLPKLRLEPNQFLLMTIRSHDQYNTTIYGLDDRYRGIYHGRRVVLLNNQDIAEAGLRGGDLVDLTSHFQGETRLARWFSVVSYEIPRRCAAAYYPETNVLVAIDNVAEKSNTPASKSTVITLSKSKERAGRWDEKEKVVEDSSEGECV